MLGYPLASPLVVNPGKWMFDITGADGCKYSAMSGVMIGGMSGGGVYNSKGELVGINIGISHLTDGRSVTTILALPSVQDWIDKTIRPQ